MTVSRLVLLSRMLQGTMVASTATLVACGPNQEEESATPHRVVESYRVAIPASGGEPSGRIDGLPRVVLAEDSRVGSLYDPNFRFSAIGPVDVDQDGNLFLFESQDLEVRVYSPDGRLMRKFGRRGDGPGEFASSNVEFGVQGDTVWFYDHSLNRLTVFNRRGELQEANRVGDVAVTLHNPLQSTMIRPVQMGGDGLLIGDRSSTIGGEFQTRLGLEDTIYVPRVRFDLQGRVIDTIGSYPITRAADTEIISVGSSRFSLPTEAGQDRIIARATDGLIVVDQTESRSRGTVTVTRLEHDGTVIQTRSFEYDPKPFPQEVLDSAVVGSTRSGTLVISTVAGAMILERNRGDSGAAANAVRQQMEFPESQLPVRAVVIADGGALLMQREQVSDRSTRWTILRGNDYAPVGDLVLSAKQRLAWTDGSTAWIEERDAFDVPWMIRYELLFP